MWGSLCRGGWENGNSKTRMRNCILTKAGRHRSKRLIGSTLRPKKKTSLGHRVSGSKGSRGKESSQLIFTGKKRLREGQHGSLA